MKRDLSLEMYRAFQASFEDAVTFFDKGIE